MLHQNDINQTETEIETFASKLPKLSLNSKYLQN